MHPYTRSRLGIPVVLMGAAFLGLAVSTACDRKDAATAAAPPAGASAAAPVTVVSATPAGQAPAPSVMVQADALISSGTPGHVAGAGGDRRSARSP